MGQVLRITVGNSDYAFRILKPDSPSRASTKIEVEMDGRVWTLIRQGRSWIGREPAGKEQQAIAEAIGKAIALRYRI